MTQDAFMIKKKRILLEKLSSNYIFPLFNPDFDINKPALSQTAH